VLRALAEARAARGVVARQLRRWDGEAAEFVDPRDPEALLEPLPPRTARDEIGWVVAVTPCSAFQRRAVRRALEARGRTIVGEPDSAIEVGCRDADDAARLVADVTRLPQVRDATPRKLGWFARWWLGQQLIGNYAAADPAQPR
jgi:hypothetical protein